MVTVRYWLCIDVTHKMCNFCMCFAGNNKYRRFTKQFTAVLERRFDWYVPVIIIIMMILLLRLRSWRPWSLFPQGGRTEWCLPSARTHARARDDDDDHSHSLYRRRNQPARGASDDARARTTGPDGPLAVTQSYCRTFVGVVPSPTTTTTTRTIPWLWHVLLCLCLLFGVLEMCRNRQQRPHQIPSKLPYGARTCPRKWHRGTVWSSSSSSSSSG